jgi:hypothetical protein
MLDAVFCSGLIPRLLCEALTIWLANTLAQVINQYIMQPNKVNASQIFISTCLTVLSYYYDVGNYNVGYYNISG